MKKKIVKKVIEEEIFISKDGKEFRSEKSCLEHEADQLLCNTLFDMDGESETFEYAKIFIAKNKEVFDAYNIIAKKYNFWTLKEPENYPAIINLQDSENLSWILKHLK